MSENLRPAVQFDAGSFRDPSGRVFSMGEALYRGVDSQTWELMRQLEACGLLQELAADGLLVKTDLVEDGSELAASLAEALPGYAGFLRHERVPFLSYPYEWSRGMLVSAGRLHLELQKRLLPRGFSLKDATAYNVQFVRGRPVFIDVPSIEVPRRFDIWIAYGQFCRMFLYPLMLQGMRNQSTRGYFMASLDGLEVDEVYRAFGFVACLRPALFFDVFLQKHLNAYGASHPEKVAGVSQGERKTGSAEAQMINLERLKLKLDKLDRVKGRSSHWVDYTVTRSYTEHGRAAKVKMIEAFLRREKPERILDLGCNTGEYSLLAASHGASVVAVDYDLGSVDALYRRLSGEDILPVWMDIVNPSPGLGFRNEERRSFLDRARFDGVMALALVHHLLVTCRLPLEAIRDLLRQLTSRWLVVEFVPREDEMFTQLLRLREDIYEEVTRERFEEVFAASFEPREIVEVKDSGRVLYLYEAINDVPMQVIT